MENPLHFIRLIKLLIMFFSSSTPPPTITFFFCGLRFYFCALNLSTLHPPPGIQSSARQYEQEQEERERERNETVPEA